MKPMLKIENLLVAYAFLTTSFYFLDTSYISREALTLIRFALLGVVALIHGFHRNAPGVILPLFAFYLIGNIGTFFLPGAGIFAKVYFSGAMVLLALYLFRLTPEEIRISASRYVNIFCYANLMSLLVWFLILVDFPMEYQIIHLNGRDLDYRKYYWVAIFCDWTIFTWNGVVVARNGGLFEEPGMFGTYCGLLLAWVYLVNIKSKFVKFSLVAFGFSSFSLSFLVLATFTLAYNIRFSLGRLISGLSVALFLIFISQPYHFIVQNMLLNRFGAGGNVLGISRESDSERMSAYLEVSDALHLLAGNGIGSNRAATEAQFSGYGSLIYEYGFFGVSILLMIFGWYYILKPLYYSGFRTMLLTVIPVLSLYQRPDFTSGVLLLFWLLVIANRNVITSEHQRRNNYAT